MSKKICSVPFIFAAVLLILQFFTHLAAQDIEASLKIVVGKNTTAEITGSFSDSFQRKNPRNLSFLNDYAGTTGLAERFSNVAVYGRGGGPVGLKRFTAAERLSDADFERFSYTVDLTPLAGRSAAAHVSWIDGTSGLIMLDDILPQTSGAKSVRVRLSVLLPVGWEVVTAERRLDTGLYDIQDAEKAVFAVAKRGSGRTVATGGRAIGLTVFGDWRFADSDASSITSAVYGGYETIFAGRPSANTQIVIMRFPGTVPFGSWEADTRGNSVTILSSDMPFKTQSIQRLREQLRHELFHLWMPNGVNLNGRYDWFYEGFALYQSLKSGVASNQIRFGDFLASLAQAYDIDYRQIDRLSLIGISEARWNGGNSRVYARGMLVAFLCDLALLQRSKGRHSVERLLREIYQKYRSQPQPLDGTTAILEMMSKYPELQNLTEKYIKGPDKIEWRTELLWAGIESTNEGSFVSLKVVPKPSGRQRDLLDKLGYNKWRELPERSK